VLEIAWASNMNGANQTIVLGTEAGLRFDPLTKITTSASRLPIEERLIPRPDADHADFGDVTIQFVRAILAGQQPLTPGREALAVTRVIDAAYRSAATGRGVSLA
ncbi:MAG TPA: hypothetical protein VKY56_09320, partial [Chloroflexota bacterium]|nr:hypothetical protein [Chloroflexota bacterium]